MTPTRLLCVEQGRTVPALCGQLEYSENYYSEVGVAVASYAYIYIYIYIYIYNLHKYTHKRHPFIYIYMYIYICTVVLLSGQDLSHKFGGDFFSHCQRRSSVMLAICSIARANISTDHVNKLNHFKEPKKERLKLSSELKRVLRNSFIW